MQYSMTEPSRMASAGGYVHQTRHCLPESGKRQSVVWMVELVGLQVSLKVECFAEGGLVRFVGMSKFRVEKSLGKITGTLEAEIESKETHQDRRSVREFGDSEQLVRVFD